jgi:hypothetical protein
MEWIISLFIGLFLGGGIFAGGWWCGNNAKPAVTINDQTQITTVESKTSQLQQSINGQFTIVDTKTNINFSLKEFTNLMQLSNWSTTNYKSVTNK